MSSLLISHLQKHVTLTTEEADIIAQYFKPKKYRKHQYILQEGEVCRYETFIISGCARTYEIDDKGQEHILQFGLEGWWIGNMYSFLSGTPSEVNVDCLEDTEVLRITKPELELLYDKIPKIDRYFRILVQNAYMAAMNRISSNLSMPALDRYREFIQKYPHIEQRVPNHQIASYLGITPQSLSRIRSQNVQKRY
jgi:CRP-like cAMP-binding protein